MNVFQYKIVCHTQQIHTGKWLQQSHHKQCGILSSVPQLFYVVLITSHTEDFRETLSLSLIWQNDKEHMGEEVFR